MKKLIVGNWKMNPDSLANAKSLFSKVKRKAGTLKKARCVICPPYIFIESLGRLSSASCTLGAQDSFWEVRGAYTSQVSPQMLKKAGAQYVILGHSEKRELGDTNEDVAKKVKIAIDYRLVVILCVGEKERDEDGKYLKFLAEEIKESLHKLPKKYFRNIVIAYEPIWAISEHESTKGASTPEDFLEKSIFIRRVLSHLTEKEIAMGIPILYGGSADENNSWGFLKEGKADGLLVGGASLDPESFNQILEISDSI